jgi:hypothetical protein
MKMANITPLYKKKDKLNKDNYRSENLLIALSKVLEKIISNQIYEHMQTLFHKWVILRLGGKLHNFRHEKKSLSEC